MHIKVHRGTAVHSESNLCETCRHSRITRGRALDEELVLCGVSHTGECRITFKVTHCSTYDDARLPSYWDLVQQAWVLVPASRKRPSGFVRASDLREEDYARYVSGVGKPGHSG